MNKKGFTLIELIAVLIVLSVILVIAIPNMINVKESGMNAIREGKIKTLVTLAEQKAEEDIDNYQDCSGQISVSSTNKCVFSVTDLMSDEDTIKGNIFICFNNSKLEAEAHYGYGSATYYCS